MKKQQPPFEEAVSDELLLSVVVEAECESDIRLYFIADSLEVSHFC